MTELMAEHTLPSRDRTFAAGPLIAGVIVDGTVRLPVAAPSPVRIRARGLRELARAADAARADQPGVVTVVDIDAIIALRASEAMERWTKLSDVDEGNALPYVGTPAGLVGLIKDLWVLGIVDGAVISTTSPSELDLVRRLVLPQLSQ